MLFLFILVGCNEYKSSIVSGNLITTNSFSLSATAGIDLVDRSGWGIPYENSGEIPFPLTQPFSGAPANYNGTEFFLNPSSVWSLIRTSGIYPNWVYVELRSTTAANSIVGQRAGLYKEDGSIVDTDGISPIEFEDVAEGSYYVVIFVDGYLPIMSAAPVVFSMGEISSIDFLDPVNIYGSADGYRIIASEAIMAGGELNYDGNIDTLDFTLLQDDTNNLLYGYLASDLNKDGVVDGIDFPTLMNNSDDFKSIQFNFR